MTRLTAKMEDHGGWGGEGRSEEEDRTGQTVTNLRFNNTVNLNFKLQIYSYFSYLLFFIYRQH